jgi:hypothetical protein
MERTTKEGIPHFVPVDRRTVIAVAGASILSFLGGPAANGQFIEPVSTAEKLLYSTTRIIGKNSRGQDTGGTGFFYRIELKDGQYTVVLITNQHVIRDTVGGVDVSVHTRTAAKGGPDGIARLHLDGSLDDAWVPHPDKIDLCAFSIQPKLNSMTPPCFLTFVDKELVPSQETINDLDAIEEVVMVGYPALLYDSQNDYPIIRRGITASDPAVDFDGKPETAIDIPAIGGSSGSPVFLYNTSGTHLDKRGTTRLGDRSILMLGIMYQGVSLNTQGEIQIMEAPTLLGQVPNTVTGKFGYQIPINVGYIIKSREIQPLVKAVLDKFGLTEQ